MRSLVLRAAAVALAVLVLPSAADAGWVTAGSVVFGSPNSEADGTINYAVYQTTTSNWTTEFSGISSSNFVLSNNLAAEGVSLATNAKYVYFFQVVNSNPFGALDSDRILERLYISRNGPDVFGQTISSAGRLWNGSSQTGGGYTFTDSNVLLDGTGGLAGAPGATPFTLSSRAQDADKFFIDDNFPTASGNSGPAARFDFGPLAAGRTSNPSRFQFSTVFFLTSENAPVTGRGSLQDTDTYTSGALPVPSPEPGTLALLGLGVPALGFGYLRRLRANKAVAAV